MKRFSHRLDYLRMPHHTEAAIDLIIPARNEQENIPALLGALPRALLRRVIVADNGSTDRTAELAIQHGAEVVHETQPGYGAACLAGLQHLTADPPDIVAFLDADLADDPTNLTAVCTPILKGEAQLVIACRHRLAQRGALTPVQRFGNALACRLIALCTGVRYGDLGPLRAVTWDALTKMNMRDRTWGWTVEMQYKAAALGMTTKQIDVSYRPRHAGKSKISNTIRGSIKAGYKILTTIAYLRWTMAALHRAKAAQQRADG